MQKPLLFLHIPKCAGTTLISVLERNFAAHRRLDVHQTWIVTKNRPVKSFDRHGVLSGKFEKISKTELRERLPLDLISGHVIFGYDRNLGFECDYFTVLRDPVRRLISEYNHAASVKEHVLYQEIQENKIDFWTYALSGFTLSSDNLQTRMLSGKLYDLEFGSCDSECLELAKQNLQKCAAFGLTERFDETLMIFKSVFGWNPMKLGYTRQRKSKVVMRASDFSGARADEVRNLNRFDEELVQFARKLFNDRLAGIAMSEAWFRTVLKMSCMRVELRDWIDRKTGLRLSRGSRE